MGHTVREHTAYAAQHTLPAYHCWLQADAKVHSKTGRTALWWTHTTFSHVLLFSQDAASNGAQLVVLPEMWNCPYSNDSFPTYAGMYWRVSTLWLSRLVSSPCNSSLLLWKPAACTGQVHTFFSDFVNTLLVHSLFSRTVAIGCRTVVNRGHRRWEQSLNLHAVRGRQGARGHSGWRLGAGAQQRQAL